MNELLARIIRVMKSIIGKKVEQAEDPILLVEQNIRDLKNDLSESLKSLAEVKAAYIRTKHENDAQKRVADEYERKAILLLEKARNGQLAEEEADRLASQALIKKDEIMRRLQSGEKGLQTYEQMVRQLEKQTMQLKMQIDQWEGEIKTLKARAQISQATRSLQERLSRTDAQGTLALLDNLKEKVTEQEAIAEAYNQLSEGRTSLDAEIDRILGTDSKGSVSNDLQRLKSQVNTAPERPLNPQAGTDVNTPFADELAKLKARLKDDKDGQ
ncbi:PspA/IM30 family protein [Rhodoflexus sp.]